MILVPRILPCRPKSIGFIERRVFIEDKSAPPASQAVRYAASSSGRCRCPRSPARCALLKAAARSRHDPPLFVGQVDLVLVPRTRRARLRRLTPEPNGPRARSSHHYCVGLPCRCLAETCLRLHNSAFWIRLLRRRFLVDVLKSSLRQFLGPAGGLRDQLVRGGIGSLGVKTGYVFLQLATGVILARVLGPADYGLYTFALALIGLLLIPTQFGFPGLLTRMVAVYRDQARFAKLKGLVSRSNQMVVLLSGVTIGGYLLAVGSLGLLPDEMPTGPLILAAALLPLMALLALNSGALYGLGHVVIGQVPNQLVRPAFLAAGLLLVNWFAFLTVERAIVVNLAATASALMLGWWFWFRNRPKKLSSEPIETSTARWMMEAAPFLLLAGTQIINQQADILMLGFLMESENVGIYKVAVQVASALGMFLLALSAVIAPHLARLHSKGEWPAISKILVSAHRTGFAVLLPVALMVALTAAPVLGFVFGNDYVSAAGALTILVVGKAIYACVAFSGLALSMFGLASVASLLTAATGMINVLLNLLLIPIAGEEGAALATAISAFSVGLFSIVWMRRKYGVDFSALGMRTERMDSWKT